MVCTGERHMDRCELELLMQCYKSGQMSEAQWQEHLKDDAFRLWLKRNNRIND